MVLACATVFDARTWMNMQKTRTALATLALVLGIPAAHAVVITSNWDPTTGTIHNLPQLVFPAANRADFSTNIEQAMSWQTVSTSIGPPVDVFAESVGCLVDGGGCTAGSAAALDASFTVAGLNGNYSGHSGGDFASADLTLSGSVTDPAWASALFLTGGLEYQRLTFTTAAPIDTILVDVAYSVFASVDQQGPGTLGARSGADVVVADAATYAPFNLPTTPYELGFIDPVFTAFANAGNLFGATNSIDGATGRSTFAIRPNTEYWVALVAGQNFLFDATADVNLTMSSSVDPVFSINEEWLASFGENRPSISIDRVVTTVPEPGTLSLVALGMLVAGFGRSRLQART